MHFLGKALLTLLMASTLVACQGLPKQSGLLEKEIAHAQISSHQLRVMINEFVVHAAHRIELRADDILANSSDPVVRRNALLWKINGISASFRAASRSDSLAAYVDLWILNRQMQHLFESPLGESMFSTWQAIPREEYMALDKRLQQIHRTIGASPQLGEAFVEKFATDFPVSNLYFDREPFASRYIEDVQERSQELFQVVASLDENLNDFKKLSILYSEHLPKQARWEAELFLMDATGMAVVQRPLQDFTLAAEAISRISMTTDSLPQLVEQQRVAISQLVSHERQATLQDVDRMRQDTISKLENERAILLAAISSERAATIDSLKEERLAATRTLNAELSRALHATDSITHRRAEQILQQAPKVIDHFVMRVVQLCTVLSLITVLAWWMLRLRRPRVTDRVDSQVPSVPDEAHEHFSTVSQALSYSIRQELPHASGTRRAA